MRLHVKVSSRSGLWFMDEPISWWVRKIVTVVLPNGPERVTDEMTMVIQIGIGTSPPKESLSH